MTITICRKKRPYECVYNTSRTTLNYHFTYDATGLRH